MISQAQGVLQTEKGATVLQIGSRSKGSFRSRSARHLQTHKPHEKDDEKKAPAQVPQHVAKEAISYNTLTKTFYSKGMVISNEEFQKKVVRCEASDFSISFEEATLGEEVLQTIAKLSNLQQLILQGCTFIAKDGDKFTDVSLTFLSETSSLQNLEISQTNKTNTRLRFDGLHAEALTALKVLDLGGSKLLPEFGELSSLFQLNRLILKNCVDVNDKSLLQVAQIISLQLLDLSGCTALTPPGLKAFAQKREKELSARRVITPITCLALDDMGDKFTDAHLVFLTHMNGLKVLSLQYSNTFSGSGLSYMPKTVVALDLRECANVRISELQKVLKWNMSSINVSGCQQVRDELVQRLREERARHNLTGEIVFAEIGPEDQVDWLASQLRKLNLHTFDPQVNAADSSGSGACVIL